MPLTAKEETYCQNRTQVPPMTQYDAHLDAYPKSKNWKRNSVDRQASVLEKKPKIVQRIEELKKPQEDLLEANRTKIVQELINIGLENKDVNPTTVTALKTLVDKLIATKTDNSHEFKGVSLLDLIKQRKSTKNE